jgi:hypothetical protein
MFGAVFVTLVWAVWKFVLTGGVMAMGGASNNKKKERGAKSDVERLERINIRLLNALVFTIVLLVLSWVGFLRYERSFIDEFITIEVGEKSDGYRENSNAAWRSRSNYNHSDYD